MASAAVSLAMGVITPNASAVSMTRFFGCPARPVFEALGMKCIG